MRAQHLPTAGRHVDRIFEVSQYAHHPPAVPNEQDARGQAPELL